MYGNLPRVQVATFNILNGRSLADDRVDVDRLAAAVRELDVDVLALQEVDQGQERSGGADLTAVAAEAMGAVDHQFVAALSGTPGATWMAATGDEQPGSAAYGIALLSRFRVRSWEIVRLPALPGRVPMLLGGRRVALVSDEPRVAVTAVVDAPDGAVTVAATHLTFVHGWNLVQLRRVVKALRRHEPPHVLLGDLNMGRRTAERASGMRSTVTALTFPADRPTRQLDHVLVRSMPGPFRGEARALPLSDHRALRVQLS